MSKKCESILGLLPDYLDGVLLDSDRIRVDKHLEDCADCRADLVAQQAWLKMRALHLPDTAVQSVPAGLNERIMAAVRSESVKPKTSKVKFLRWQNLAGTAAAVLLLIAVWQIVPLLFSMGSQPKSEYAGMGNDLVELDPSSVSGTPTRDTQGWILSSIYGSPTQGTTASTSSTDSKDCAVFENLTVLNDILAESSEVRYLTQSADSQQILILAAFDTSEIDLRLASINNALTPCETPIQIEIIKRDDLRGKLDSMDETLYNISFPEPPLGSYWIFILIGA